MFEFAKFSPEPEARFYSLGHVCQHLQIHPATLRELMELTGTRFVRMIDGVPYLDGHGFLAVADKCKEARDALDDAAAKCEAAPNN